MTEPQHPSPPPSPWCDTIHTMALALWLAALVLGGVSAAVMFPAMRAVNPTLSGFPGFEDEHWKIAAGMVQQRIFLVGDAAQFVAALAAFMTLGMRLTGLGAARASRRPATLVRTIAVGAAMLLLSYHLLVLAPRLSRNLAEFYAHAGAGRPDQARTAREAFNADHPTATGVLAATTLAVAVALAGSVWSLARPPRAPPKPGQD